MNSKLYFMIFIIFYATSDFCFAQRPSKHISNDFSAVLQENQESVNFPTSIYLGSVRPIYEADIKDIYFFESDSLLSSSLFFDLLLFDEDSLRYLKLNMSPNKRNNQIHFQTSLIKKIPKETSALPIFDNYVGRNLKEYPYNKKLEISENIYINCMTYQGCLDTDRCNIELYVDNAHIFTQSNLGWVSIIKIDINNNDILDIIYVSTKFCERKLDFYALIL